LVGRAGEEEERLLSFKVSREQMREARPNLAQRANLQLSEDKEQWPEHIVNNNY
jgi:hypothetical protein